MNEIEIGKLIAQIESVSDKVERNTRLMERIESCLEEAKRDNKKDITKLTERLNDTNQKLREVSERLLLYSTVVKVVKTMAVGALLILTFKFGDVKELITGLWK